jgi:hypothetical protein
MERTVRSLNPSRFSRTLRQRKTVSPTEGTPAPASQEAGVTQQSQDVSTAQNTETDGTQGAQGEFTTQETDITAIQETQSAAILEIQSAAIQEGHEDDDDNGSNGSGISDDGEPWQTIDADPGTLNICHNAYLFYNFSLFLI